MPLDKATPMARRFMPVFCACLFATVASASDEPSGGNPPPAVFQGQPAAIANAGVPVAGQEAADLAPAAAMLPASEAAPQADAARVARRAAFDAVVNTQRAKIRALTDRLASTVGEDAILELQQEIAREKRATQRQLLELQLEMAVRETDPAGDRTRIEKLEAALTAWDAPRPVLQLVDRPTPVNPAR